nr:hypothetical protein [Spirochaetota bacterium]
WDRFNNTWNMKLLYNTISADFRFKNDISVLGAFILRYTHGAINADWSGTTNNAGEYTKPNDNDKTALANYHSIPDYWSWGLAFQFKYVIPVKILKTPILFCNLSFGWDPFQYFDPGYLETMDYNSSNYDRGTAADWSQNNIHSFQFSQLTVGLQWDF